MKTIVVTFQNIAYVIFQLARSPGLGGSGGGVRRVGYCEGETVPTLLVAEWGGTIMKLVWGELCEGRCLRDVV